MSITDKNKIDIVSLSNDKVILTIADHLEWGDRNHRLQIQEKLNTYFGFIETGQILEDYPKSLGKKILIELVFDHVPEQNDLEFLALIKEFVDKAGYEFTFYQMKFDNTKLS